MDKPGLIFGLAQPEIRLTGAIEALYIPAMRGALTLPALLTLAFGLGDSVDGVAQTAPSIDSILSVVRPRLAYCDSIQTSATFVTTTHERKLDRDGNIENEKTYRSRVYARGKEQREVLLAMWENGEPVADKKLHEEQRKREKERQKREKELRSGKGESRKRNSSRVLEPLLAENEQDYLFPEVTPDTIGGINAWRVSVEPLAESEDLVRGFIWLDQTGCTPLAERYEPAKLPSKIQAMNVEIDYTEIDDSPMPGRFRITGNGKALFFIKFNFQAEVIFDSVRINPELPDSLFVSPE